MTSSSRTCERKVRGIKKFRSGINPYYIFVSYVPYLLKRESAYINKTTLSNKKN